MEFHKTVNKKILKIFKVSAFALIIIIFTMSAIAQGLLNLQFRQSDRKILNKFKTKDYKPSIEYTTIRNRQIRYIYLHRNDSLPLLVFVHGSPGSSLDYISYLLDDTLNLHYNMISFDRPGYGYSGFGESLTSIRENARIVKELINRFHPDKTILLGHSYGGPIALRVAMDYPDAVDELLLLAPALDPDNELIFKIAYLAKWPITRLLTPTALKVAADEKFSHADELRKMLPLYDHVKCKVTHIHSINDDLVPYENLKFMEQKISDDRLEAITLDKGNHFLPWTKFNLVRDHLLEMSEVKIE